MVKERLRRRQGREKGGKGGDGREQISFPFFFGGKILK